MGGVCLLEVWIDATGNRFRDAERLIPHLVVVMSTFHTHQPRAKRATITTN